MTACPTNAIVKPYQVDARLCISYLTIEHDSEIPLELRPLVGTRIYGCDDCQLACPWNKFAKPAEYADFNPREEFDQPDRGQRHSENRLQTVQEEFGRGRGQQRWRCRHA